jgi:hypothetical protein
MSFGGEGKLLFLQLPIKTAKAMNDKEFTEIRVASKPLF